MPGQRLRPGLVLEHDGELLDLYAVADEKLAVDGARKVRPVGTDAGARRRAEMGAYFVARKRDRLREKGAIAREGFRVLDRNVLMTSTSSNLWRSIN